MRSSVAATGRTSTPLARALRRAAGLADDAAVRRWLLALAGPKAREYGEPTDARQVEAARPGGPAS
jgi:hypothetical protein